LAVESPAGTVVIGPKAVNESFGMKEAIGVVEGMCRAGADEILSQPARTIFKVNEDSVILTMPAFSRDLNRFAVKIVTEFKRNSEEYGLPVQGGTILLIDCDNSRLLAMIDSPAVTAVRTGALGGLAAKILSRRDSKRVGVVGSGKQARTQLEGVCAVRDIREVKVASRNRAHSKEFAKEMSQKLEVEVKDVTTPGEAAREADIVIAATSSPTPVLKSDDVTDGCHINSIGALPDRTELSADLIARSSVFVDTRAGVLNEAGDVMKAIREGGFSKEMVKADLAELVLSRRRGRTSPREVTLFKSVGFALVDVYSASYIYDKLAHGRGSRSESDVGQIAPML
jgi:ornithine cyclodeaminase/alanine dehydrogenase-like protein (mu-crystallin family)